MITLLNKYYLITLFLNSIVFTSLIYSQSEKQINKDDCTFNGLKLYGKIQFVDSFPDIKVQIVNSFPDLEVKIVDSFPDNCGEWQIVDSFPDLKVQIVDSFADLKIKYVESFPGIP